MRSCGRFVVARGDAAEVLEAAEDRFDPPAIPIPSLVEADLARAGAGAGNDHAECLLAQVLAQPVGIVALVGDEPPPATGCPGQYGGRGLDVTGVAGVRWMTPGRPIRSVRTWILMVGPAREGPIACSRPPFSAVGGALGFHVGRVEGSRFAGPSGLARASSMPVQKRRRDHLLKRLWTVMDGP